MHAYSALSFAILLLLNLGAFTPQTCQAAAELSSLQVSDGTLSPPFSAATTNYTLSVPNTTTAITVTAAPWNAMATLEIRVPGSGFTNLPPKNPSAPIPLDVGPNSVEIRVTPLSETPRTYQITVIRVPFANVDNLDLAVNNAVHSTAIQPDGKIIIVGQFTSVLGASRNRVARINQDGTLDQYFDPNVSGLYVRCVAVQADGKVLIGGWFTSLRPNNAGSPTMRTNLARLHADGTLDSDFDLAPNGQSICLTVLPNNQILLGGQFTHLESRHAPAPIPRSSMARLNVDGTVDSGFNPRPDGYVAAFAMQPDGKILVGGLFNTFRPSGGETVFQRSNVVRLEIDGAVDPVFDPRPDDSVGALAVQPDGKVLIGGYFSSLQPNGAPFPTARFRIARVNTDGTIDSGFDPRASSSGGTFVRSIGVQADGKVLLGGYLHSLRPNGATTETLRNSFARVHPDGSLDSDFNPNVSGNTADGLTMQADGKVLLFGGFIELQPPGAGAPIPRRFLARILNDRAIQSLRAADRSRVVWSRGGSSPEVSHVSFELSTNGGTNWFPVGNGIRIGTSSDWELTGLSLPASGHLRARSFVSGGYLNGSSSLIETKVSFSGLGFQPMIHLQSLKRLSDGSFQFLVYNPENTPFSIVSSTNLFLPTHTWTEIDSKVNLGNGFYEFTAPGVAAIHGAYYYRLRVP